MSGGSRILRALRWWWGRWRRSPCAASVGVHSFIETRFGGDSEQVRELDGRGEHGDVGLAFHDAADGFAQGAVSSRKIPLVDADGRDSAPRSRSAGQEFGIRLAIFLDGDASLGAIRCRGEQFAPGVRLGHRDR